MTEKFMRIWCDVNARGWMQRHEPGDPCYYVFDEVELNSIHPAEGMRVLLYMDEVEIPAILERFRDSWRARPV